MKKVQFKSQDGLLITADQYDVNNPKGMILLCHRSHCNRAEYRETAPKFNRLGYSCIAIDQRSGMKVFGEENETKSRAKAQKLPTGFLDVRPDIEAAIQFAFEQNGQQAIILLGSSYSASLALLIGKEKSEVKAIITFSPGEYLKGIDLASEITNLDKAVFATSAQSEIEQTLNVFSNVNPDFVTHHRPKDVGFHGSKILWESVKGYEQQWNALTSFLLSLQ